jgi:hypothetical protein
MVVSHPNDGEGSIASVVERASIFISIECHPAYLATGKSFTCTLRKTYVLALVTNVCDDHG